MEALGRELAAVRVAASASGVGAGSGDEAGTGVGAVGRASDAERRRRPRRLGGEVVVDEALHGWTALHVACAASDAELVRRLLGATPSDGEAAVLEATSNQYRHTALHVAACVGAEAAVRALLEAGAVIQRKDENGFTALHFAAAQGYRSTVECILDEMKRRDACALVNELDKEMNTALALAQRGLNAKVAETIQTFVSRNFAEALVDTEEVAEVTTWLTDTVGLPQYIPAFVSSGYTRLSFWAETGLSPDEFQEIGVLLRGHQRIINKFLAEYNTKDDGTASGSGSGSDHSDNDQNDHGDDDDSANDTD